MALVDYSSDSASSGPEAEVGPPRKKPKPEGGGHDNTAQKKPEAAATKLPPLPAAFHDLYASTVRASTVDDPSLHQGRTRRIPHVAGNWPSHIYIEWFPTPEEHALLSGLLDALRDELRLQDPSSPGGEEEELHSFLTSPLGAPQPLHISLSRPFVLQTRNKDAFLADLVDAVSSSSSSFSPPPPEPFEVTGCGVDWHRSPDSDRAFLVLRVCSVSAAANPGKAGDTKAEGSGEAQAQAQAQRNQSSHPKNPELMDLLGRCNALVTAAGQPALYTTPSSTTTTDTDAAAASAAEDAFHVSLAWSFAARLDALEAATARARDRSSFAPSRAAALRIRVDDVKAKIGNVVTSIPLLERAARYRRGGRGGAGQTLFGM